MLMYLLIEINCNENQLTEFYIELNNIISIYNSKINQVLYLVLAVMINFDKSLSLMIQSNVL